MGFLSVPNLVPWLIFRAWILLDHIALQLNREGIKGREDAERGGRGGITRGRWFIEGRLLFEEIWQLEILVTTLRQKYAMFKLTVCQKGIETKKRSEFLHQLSPFIRIQASYHAVGCQQTFRGAALHFFILNSQRKQEATWLQVIRLEILLKIKPKGK